MRDPITQMLIDEIVYLFTMLFAVGIPSILILFSFIYGFRYLVTKHEKRREGKRKLKNSINLGNG